MNQKISVIWQPIFGDLSQSEKNDENKPPLVKNITTRLM
jgi:hypothetical protein